MDLVLALAWKPIESRLFSSVAYREEARQLYLRFRDGLVYRYFEFPGTAFEAFMSADSKGAFFARRIRGRFREELLHRPTRCSEPENLSLEEQLRASVLLAKARPPLRA